MIFSSFRSHLVSLLDFPFLFAVSDKLVPGSGSSIIRNPYQEFRALRHTEERQPTLGSSPTLTGRGTGYGPSNNPTERLCAFLRITFIFSPCYCEMGSFHPSAAPHRRWETFRHCWQKALIVTPPHMWTDSSFYGVSQFPAPFLWPRNLMGPRLCCMEFTCLSRERRERVALSLSSCVGLSPPLLCLL